MMHPVAICKKCGKFKVRFKIAPGLGYGVCQHCTGILKHHCMTNCPEGIIWITQEKILSVSAIPAINTP